jgi:hypothetical protein
MEQGPSWDVKSRYSRQEIPWYYGTGSLFTLLAGPPVLSQINPIHILITYFLTIHSNTILQSTPRSSDQSLPLQAFLPKCCMQFSSLPYVLDSPPTYSMIWLNTSYEYSYVYSFNTSQTHFCSRKYALFSCWILHKHARSIVVEESVTKSGLYTIYGHQEPTLSLSRAHTNMCPIRLSLINPPRALRQHPASKHVFCS